MLKAIEERTSEAVKALANEASSESYKNICFKFLEQREKKIRQLPLKQSAKLKIRYLVVDS